MFLSPFLFYKLKNIIHFGPFRILRKWLSNCGLVRTLKYRLSYSHRVSARWGGGGSTVHDIALDFLS
jgi:hypothetical protein